MRKKIFGYIFFFLFQMFGAVVSAEAGNYVMIGWCTYWAVYAVMQIERLAKENRTESE